MTLTAPTLALTAVGLLSSSARWSGTDERLFTASGAWPTADLAIYIPVVVPIPSVVKYLGLANGSAVSGNFDAGIYSASGTRLVSTGATAQSGTNALQLVDVTDTTLQKGLYYFAAVLDNTTGAVDRLNPAAPNVTAWGVISQQLGASGTLPATATWAVDQTLAYSPNIVAMMDTTTT